MATPRGRVRYSHPGPGSAAVEMESGHHKQGKRPACFIVYFFALTQQNSTFRSTGFQAWGDKSSFMYAFKQG